VLPPIAGDEAEKALNADQDRPKKGEYGYLGGLDRQVCATAVRGHDHGDAATIRQVRDAHSSRSLRARWLKAQPDLRTAHHNDGPGVDSPVDPAAAPGQTGLVRPERGPRHEAVRSGVGRSPENCRAGIDSWTRAREIELAMAATPAVIIERTKTP